MELDLGHERPRRPAQLKDMPLEPSPVERRRERLAVRAQEHHAHPSPAARTRPVMRQPSLKPRDRKLTRDIPAVRRSRRTDLPPSVVGLSLREEEINALTTIGRFRVVATRDLAEAIYSGRVSESNRDLRFLAQNGVVEIDSVNARRDGRGGKVERIEVVTLTKQGRDLARQIGGLPEIQKLYYGIVKPREVEHDTQIYRAYLKESNRIREQGGSNLRVQLDFELKSKIQKAIYAERKGNPTRDMLEIKKQVAEQFQLPLVKDRIQIPDARIEYDQNFAPTQELDQGARTGHQDIEVLTAAYHPNHLRSKAQAGFRVYASSSDRSTLTTRVEGDHHLMESILEL